MDKTDVFKNNVSMVSVIETKRINSITMPLEKPGRIQCATCEQWYSNKQYLKKHIRWMHIKDQCFACDDCDKKYTSKQSLMKHIETNHRPHAFECDSCPKTFSTAQNRKQHIAARHTGVKLHKCPYCTKIFYSRTGKNQHVRERHREKYEKDRVKRGLPPTSNVPKEKTKYECEICHKKLVSKQNLAFHTKHFHGSHEVQKYTCEPCAKQFTFLSNLRKHMIQHLSTETRNSLRIFKCAVCETRFLRKKDLVSHLKKVHLTDKIVKEKFKCDDCGKKYCRNSDLEKHQKYLCANDGHWKCYTCEKIFGYKNSLKKHIRQMHLDAKYICDICGKESSRKEDLKKHMEHCHLPRDFKCDFCPKRYTTAFALKEHTASHGSTKLYTCPYCLNKNFNRRNTLYKHFTMKHSEEWKKDKFRSRQKLN